MIRSSFLIALLYLFIGPTGLGQELVSPSIEKGTMSTDEEDSRSPHLDQVEPNTDMLRTATMYSSQEDLTPSFSSLGSVRRGAMLTTDAVGEAVFVQTAAAWRDASATSLEPDASESSPGASVTAGSVAGSAVSVQHAPRPSLDRDEVSASEAYSLEHAIAATETPVLSVAEDGVDNAGSGHPDGTRSALETLQASQADRSSSLGMVTYVTGQPEEMATCSEVMCQIGDGLSMMNTSMCPFSSRFQINATYVSQAVIIWPNPEDKNTVECKWELLVPEQHWVILTFDRLTFDSNYVAIKFPPDPYEDETPFHMDELSRGSVNMTKKSDFQINYINYGPYMTGNVTFHYALVRNTLPAVRLSNSSGYVTSPAFDHYSHYPSDFDGTHEIRLPESQSVIVKFTDFDVEPPYPSNQCDSDYVMIDDLSDVAGSNTTVWKQCGRQKIPLLTFRSSIRLRFVSDSYSDYTGFKMKYVTVPTDHEPVLLTEPHSYDCSVAHFDTFSYILRCNFIRECEGNEDEKDCEYQFSPLNDCSEGLCQTDTHFFVIDASSSPQGIEVKASTEPSTLAVMVNPRNEEYSLYSQWTISVPDRHQLLVTFRQLHSDVGNATIDLEDPSSLGVVNATLLQQKNVSVTSLIPVDFIYRNYKPYSSAVITLDFYARPNILPSGTFSETAGFVISPNFSMDNSYPKYYHGTFDINIPESFSVLIKVAYLSITYTAQCEEVFLMIYEIHQEHVSDQLIDKLCGEHHTKSVSVFNSSVRVRFKSSRITIGSGFRMLYAFLPTHLQPQFSNDDLLYNCSVPHFALFEPVFSCDLTVECRGEEDEAACGYSGNCGPMAVEAGRKCYTRRRPDSRVTWYSASNECNNQQQQLITAVDRESLSRLKSIVFTFDLLNFFVGLQLSTPVLAAPASFLYRTVWQWEDGRSAFTVNVKVAEAWVYTLKTPFPLCTVHMNDANAILSAHCFEPMRVDILCEFDTPGVSDAQSLALNTPWVENTNMTFPNLSMVPCELGHVTRDFLFCDSQSQCGAESQTCHADSNVIPMFQCDSSQQMPYTLVCDYVPHCSDGSDENFCHFTSCTQERFQCQNRQCIDISSICDGKQDCVDHSDEICQLSFDASTSTVDPPAVVDMIGDGSYDLTQSPVCPGTHFSCSDGYCLPGFVRCNGAADCVGGEDEAGCNSYVCRGFYRCIGSAVCVHPTYMCDGVFHCPHYDDELLCEEPVCPEVCSCQGLEFACTDTFPIGSYPELRYLHMTNTTVSTDFISHSRQLIGVHLSRTGIRTISNLALPNLQLFDLSYNEIASINMQSFYNLKNIRRLILKGNPVQTVSSFVVVREEGFALMSSSRQNANSDPYLPLKEVDLSHSQLETFDGSAFTSYPQLQMLNVSHSKLYAIYDEGFTSIAQLKTVDFRSSKLKEFPNDLLKNLAELQTVYADNFLLCCEAMLPEGFDSAQCHAEQDLLTSCEDLLRFETYRAFLWMFALLSVVGNIGSFVARMRLSKGEKKLSSFSIFVANLCVADFFMGVYLAIIGTADQVYLGDYLWHSEQWRHSVPCSVAGFLSLLSSEVSAFIICLITLDRFLVLRFPFSAVHFGKTSALVACSVVWTLGVVLAAVPLLPFTSHWDFYSQTGICIPLPFSTGDRFEGHDYAFAVMIAINFVLFLLIAVGQVSIFWSIRQTSMVTSNKDTASKHAVIARRLATVVLSDFLCWFPIGLLGLLASTGTPISGEINVGVAIFVLPFNSALNPFLYTFNTVMEKRQKAAEERLMKRLAANFQSTGKTPTAHTATSQPSDAEQTAITRS